MRMLTSLDLLEQQFFDPSLLSTNYFAKKRAEYLDAQSVGFNNPLRDYPRLLRILTEVRDHRADHANSYTKRLRSQHRDYRSCEAVFSELIVYVGNLRLRWEGHLAEISLEIDSYDLALTRPDGSHAYLEILCVMPNPEPDANNVIHYQTHTQQASSSIRQKLVQKIERKQLTSPRENWAVIELNDSGMTPFAALSSLSNGYVVRADSEGYDWTNSFFDDPRTGYICGVIYFFAGNYAGRRVLLNPSYSRTFIAGTSAT